MLRTSRRRRNRTRSVGQVVGGWCWWWVLRWAQTLPSYLSLATQHHLFAGTFYAWALASEAGDIRHSSLSVISLFSICLLFSSLSLFSSIIMSICLISLFLTSNTERTDFWETGTDILRHCLLGQFSSINLYHAFLLFPGTNTTTCTCLICVLLVWRTTNILQWSSDI